MLGELALASLGHQPLLKWPGGKWRFAHRFRARIPAHRVYVEPFFGGGSMFFVKDEAPLSILGDLTERSIRFHVAVRNGALRRCKKGVRLSRAAVARGLRGGASACEMLAWAGSSYHGMAAVQQTGIDRVKGASYGRAKLRRLADYEGMLRRAHLTIGDFRRTIRLGDKKGGKDAFFFLDPPWPGIGGYSKKYARIGGKDGSGDELSPKKVREGIGKVRGKAWVIYNDHPAVREAFCGRRGKWRCHRIRMQTSDPSRGGMRVTPWILATNYRMGR